MEEFHYGDYLRSDRWQELRDAAIEKAEGRCQVCDSPDDLNVHHRTYERLQTDDEWRDLVVLCRVCHEGYHFLFAERRPGRVDRTLINSGLTYVSRALDGTETVMSLAHPWARTNG